MSVPRTTGGPSPADWEHVRPLIQRLYIEEDRTLSDVMIIMTCDHGHKATTKMYKSRFTKWEFDKHLRQSDMVVVLRKKRARDAQGKASTFKVRTKEVSAQDVERYVDRKQALNPAFGEAPADVATPRHIQCFTPPCSPHPAGGQGTSLILGERESLSADGAVTPTGLGKRKRSRSPIPVSRHGFVVQQKFRCVQMWTRSPSVPRSVTTPEGLRRPEVLFQHISSYVRGSISNGTWYTNHLGSLQCVRAITIHPSDFYDLCYQASGNFIRSLAVQGRRLLTKAFSFLATLLREEHPDLLKTLIDTFIRMRQYGFVGICAIIQNHIAELARTILPEQHIWRKICISLSYFDPDHEEVITRSWRSMTDSLAHMSGKFSYSSIACEVDFIHRVYRPTEPRRAEQLLRKLLVNFEQVSEEVDEKALYVVCPLADTLYQQGRYAEFVALLEDTLLRAREAGTLLAFREAYLLERLAWAQYMLYKDGPAEASVRSAIALYAKSYGKCDPTVIRCCYLLEGWLRKRNRDAEADELLTEIDEMIGPDDIEVDAISPNSFLGDEIVKAGV